MKLFGIRNIPAIAVVLTDREVHSLNREDLSGADIIELRVDMFESLNNIEEVFTLAIEKFKLPIILTVRAPSEGGKREILNRLTIYERLINYSDFVDIEILSNEVLPLRKMSKEYGKIMICSYHRFDLTPSIDELERISEKAKSLDADIIKIATMVNYKSDLEALLNFTLNHKNDKIIVIGMGIKGVPSRVINPVFGSLITYANITVSSAPGQIHLKDMVHIFKTLGLR
jgi:3-dehydroquinate dehydratase type I